MSAARWFHADRYEQECAAFDAANPRADDDGIAVTVSTWATIREPAQPDAPSLFIGDDGAFYVRLPGGTTVRVTYPMAEAFGTA